MPYIPFHDICPETAEKETRVITLLHDKNEYDLPTGDYIFVELFCDECDCRRVFFQVFLNQRIVATISYGWEKPSFYRKMFMVFDKEDVKDLKSPSIDSFQYQTEISAGILKLFKQVLFSDKFYLARVEQHYSQFRKAL